MNNYQSTRPERFSIWSYFFGQSMANSMLSGFLTTYLMLVGLDLGQVAIVMVLVKLWDAVNDTIFGILFDTIHFKSGHQSLPWLRISMFAIPIATIILFQIPGAMGSAGKMLWFVLAYILWDASYTLSDIPIYNLVTRMTVNLDERNTVLSSGRMLALAGTFVTSQMVTFLISENVGLPFSQAALLLALIILITMVPVSFAGRERVKTVTTTQKYSLAGMWHYLRQNVYLRRYYIGFIISGVSLTYAAVDLFVSYYFFGSALVSSLTLVIIAIPMLIFASMMGRILKRVDKFRLFFWGNVGFVGASVLLYLFGRASLPMYLALVAVRAIPMAIVFTLNLTFTPDVVEFGTYTSGVDARGIAFAIQSYAGKLTALAQPLGLFILAAFHWSPIHASSFAVLAHQHITQSSVALQGLWLTATLIPGIGYALALIPYSRYHLNDHDVQLMADVNAGKLDRATAEAQMSRHYGGDRT